VAAALGTGARTGDLTAPGETALGCRAMGDLVLAKLAGT
jgi:hypothetical protein